MVKPGISSAHGSINKLQLATQNTIRSKMLFLFQLDLSCVVRPYLKVTVAYPVLAVLSGREIFYYDDIMIILSILKKVS